MREKRRFTHCIHWCVITFDFGGGPQVLAIFTSDVSGVEFSPANSAFPEEPAEIFWITGLNSVATFASLVVPPMVTVVGTTRQRFTLLGLGRTCRPRSYRQISVALIPSATHVVLHWIRVSISRKRGPQ
jgi:hypothetical protein